MSASAADELDVITAAKVAGRTPETIRRWVWAGKLSARKRGNRLVVRRGDLEALAAVGGEPTLSLPEWAKLAEDALRRHGGPYCSAADLVLEERHRRDVEVSRHPGR
ncbi:MAG TPA: helix-turn-helix domain-containing protein [Candidatus Nitrosotalea sp.]|nr:helix-turn-helix domain-containing protein [Candidatus Nitrosotalea sp.]